MAIIAKPNTFSAGATIIASEHNANFDTIYNDYNGNITNANIASNASITDTKLAQITTAGKVTLGSFTVSGQTKGDVPYYNGTTWGRGWDVGCRATKSGTQSLSVNTLTAITFTGTDDWDTDTMHDPASNSTRITATTGGKYLVIGQITYATTANAASFEAQVRVNGATVIAANLIYKDTTTGDHAVQVVTHWNATATDYIELMGRQSAGSLDVSDTNTWFSVQRMA